MLVIAHIFWCSEIFFPYCIDVILAIVYNYLYWKSVFWVFWQCNSHRLLMLYHQCYDQHLLWGSLESKYIFATTAISCSTENLKVGLYLKLIHVFFFYKKSFYKKMSLKKPQSLQKILRKSRASNTRAAVFENADFS